MTAPKTRLEFSKTGNLQSYGRGIQEAFPTRPVKHIITEGIRAVINNNLSEGA